VRGSCDYSRASRRKGYVCVRRKRVVKLVIVRYEMLSKNQAEIRQKSGRNQAEIR
jgi:hypothetical protein